MNACSAGFVFLITYISAYVAVAALRGRRVAGTRWFASVTPLATPKGGALALLPIAARRGGRTRAFVPSERRGQTKFFIFITTDQ